MKLRWKKEPDGKLTLQLKEVIYLNDSNPYAWQDIPIFEPKEELAKPFTRDDVHEAVAAERERCAKIVDDCVAGTLTRDVAKLIRSGN